MARLFVPCSPPWRPQRGARPDTPPGGRSPSNLLGMSNTPVGPYTPVVRAGNWIIVSGQLGMKDGAIVDGGITAAYVTPE